MTDGKIGACPMRYTLAILLALLACCTTDNASMPTEVCLVDQGDRIISLDSGARVPIRVVGHLVDPEEGTILKTYKDTRDGPWRPFGQGAYSQEVGIEELGRTPKTWYTYDALESDEPALLQHAAIVVRENDEHKPRIIAKHLPVGAELWAAELPEDSWSARPPQWVQTDAVVVVACGIGLIGLDSKDGAHLWKRGGPFERLYAESGQVYSTSNDEGEGTILQACNVHTGDVLFSVRLPGLQDPRPLLGWRGGVVVSDRNNTAVVDSKGQLLAEISEQAIACFPVLGGVVVLTPHRLWTVGSEQKHSSIEINITCFGLGVAGQIVEAIEDDCIVVTLYSQLTLSEVRVLKVDLVAGEVLWNVLCAAGLLDFAHSAFWHYAYSEVRGEYVYVVSQSMASRRDFIQVLCSMDGTSVSRWDLR